MADTDSNFDDERLSAYLDGELTAEERARVEERLSADPASRQLLDELRSVSQAMQGLPHAKLGDDLREGVLRRAERAMLVAKDESIANRPSAGGLHMPFGRSKRAWFWAATALAAALLFMFVERDDQRNAGLPKEVALKPPAIKQPDGPLPPLAMRAIESKDEAPPAEDVDLFVAEAETARDESRADDLAATEADAAGRAAATTDDVSHFAGGVEGAIARGDAGAAGRQLFVEGAADSDVMVVHVSLTPEAMQNRAFETTLLNNQIEVESETEFLADKPAEPHDVEVVVVEAAPAQLHSTLAELKRDTKNYRGIAVEQQAASSQLGLDKKKQQEWSDMQQYNRGRVANQQQVQLDARSHYYSYSPSQELTVRARRLLHENAQAADRYGASSSGDSVGDGSAESGASAPQSLALDRDQRGAASAVEQALPAQTPAAEARQNSASESLARSKLNIARRATQKLAEKADLLQVLFVLQADETSASTETPAAVPTSAAPAGGGLKRDE